MQQGHSDWCYNRTRNCYNEPLSLQLSHHIVWLFRAEFLSKTSGAKFAVFLKIMEESRIPRELYWQVVRIRMCCCFLAEKTCLLCGKALTRISFRMRVLFEYAMCTKIVAPNLKKNPNCHFFIDCQRFSLLLIETPFTFKTYLYKFIYLFFKLMEEFTLRVTFIWQP